jgi:hypothetical protein
VVTVDFLHEEEVLAWYPSVLTHSYLVQKEDPTRKPGEVRINGGMKGTLEAMQNRLSGTQKIDPFNMSDTLDANRSDPFHGTD